MGILSYFFPLIAAMLCHVAWAERGTTCNCGWVNKGRIVGGYEARKNEFPWMAGLFDRKLGQLSCGAAIVTRRHAITATHCRRHMDNPNVGLLVGAHDLRNLRGSLIVPIEVGVLHADFDKRGYTSDDIAVIVTSVPIPFSTYVGPVCLPTGPLNLDNQVVKAIGWGKQGPNIPSSPTLKAVDMRVVPEAECRKWWGNGLVTPKSQMCVMDGNKTPCNGDSGGPWVWLDPETNRYTLVGVTSYGSDCVAPPPAVNTDVGVYMPWIKQIIRDNKPEEICTKI